MLGKPTIKGRIGFALAIFLLVSFCLLPFAQILSTSLKHQFDWGNPSLIPQVVNLDAYKELLGLTEQKQVEIPAAIQKILENPKLPQDKKDAIMAKYTSNTDVFPFGRFMLNSFAISAGAATVSLIFAVMGAYSISRLRFTGQVIVQRSVLFVYMVGGVLLMVPLYQMAVNVGLATSMWGSLFCLFAIYIVQTLPVALYMLGNYFRTIPFALEEAAMMDGYSRKEAIWKVVLPLSVPMLATVFMYCFIIGWNEYLFASVFLKQFKEFYTLPLALQELFVSKNAIWDRIMAASMLTLAPVVVCFLFAMRHMDGGKTDGGVKG
ncbi:MULTISPECIES: carbohydrate ABC transporter permease [Vibrio]|uniref:Carbohydrate ABC transporter permease n=1 Tax=Vibrio mediterranei TaxID=689 RepID=A0ABX5DFW8_9VIBR|nr:MULTISPECIES: carbohydrate ABC transporter permease [Vibrio]KFA98333.1 ABC transporter permease [Vibrio sp. ER1A]MCG9625340.1 carbohydrate ABC transporter permease [Vibrio mediterranei]MCG9656581.1 carbohydrate ABC transporter permease [Vibrio mediterranei]MCG9663871.1 carbohydrate ABC transporter permease [Vibrio mediterranei]MCG9789343.1 carbohydrate ABC transporter permease [Vibrio mediterranei]